MVAGDGLYVLFIWFRELFLFLVYWVFLLLKGIEFCQMLFLSLWDCPVVLSIYYIDKEYEVNWFSHVIPTLYFWHKFHLAMILFHSWFYIPSRLLPFLFYFNYRFVKYVDVFFKKTTFGFFNFLYCFLFFISLISAPVFIISFFLLGLGL